MLDDLNVLKQRDPQDAIGVAKDQWQQLKHDFGVTFEPKAEIKNVVLAGMGGSALPGVFLYSWPGLSVPFEIVRNYDIPKYVNENTLFISSSVSGNTEEALSALDQAEQAGAQIVVVASGGKLLERAKEAAYPTYLVSGDIQPRMTTFYYLAAFVQLLEPLGLVPEGSRKELTETADWLKDQIQSWMPEVNESDNQAKQLAQKLAGKSVVMYGGPKMFPVANKWKICCNENAKNVAWVYQLPEFNHNEFIGWSSHPVEKPYAVVDLRSGLEHPRIQKRFEVSERLLSGLRPSPNVENTVGDTLLQQLLWTSNLGDFTTLYLAILNGVNPTPVDLVEKFKVELNK